MAINSIRSVLDLRWLRAGTFAVLIQLAHNHFNIFKINSSINTYSPILLRSLIEKKTKISMLTRFLIYVCLNKTKTGLYKCRCLSFPRISRVSNLGQHIIDCH